MGKALEYRHTMQSVAATVAQIHLALRQVSPEIVRLRVLIEQMSAELTALRAVPERHCAGSDAADEGDLLLQRLADILCGVDRLQLYDRLLEDTSHLQLSLP